MAVLPIFDVSSPFLVNKVIFGCRVCGKFSGVESLGDVSLMRHAFVIPGSPINVAAYVPCAHLPCRGMALADFSAQEKLVALVMAEKINRLANSGLSVRGWIPVDAYCHDCRVIVEVIDPQKAYWRDAGEDSPSYWTTCKHCNREIPMPDGFSKELISHVGRRGKSG